MSKSLNIQTNDFDSWFDKVCKRLADKLDREAERLK